MTIHLAHLYYDILNLYGESGNIKALKKELENQGFKVLVHFATIDDKLDFALYDLIYIGAGTEDNQKLVIPHLMKYKDEIKRQIERKKVFLITGNSVELFGKHIIDKGGKEHKTLNIFDFYAKEEEFRMIDEAIFKCDFIEKPIIGFQNQSSVIRENEKPIFKVVKGIGSFPKSKGEGVNYNNFYGTYLIGPVLVRNPELLKFIIKKLILKIYPSYQFGDFDLDTNYKAYDAFIDNFYQKIS